MLWIGESDEVFIAFLEKSNQKLEPEPRKTDINNNMVAVLLAVTQKAINIYRQPQEEEFRQKRYKPCLER